MADDQFKPFSPTQPVVKAVRRFHLRIEYPASPAEVLWNAMGYTVTEDFANKVAKEYLGDLRAEMVDGNGLQFRRYGRIVLQEIQELFKS